MIINLCIHFFIFFILYKTINHQSHIYNILIIYNAMDSNQHLLKTNLDNEAANYDSDEQFAKLIPPDQDEENSISEDNVKILMEVKHYFPIF